MLLRLAAAVAVGALAGANRDLHGKPGIAPARLGNRLRRGQGSAESSASRGSGDNPNESP